MSLSYFVKERILYLLRRLVFVRVSFFSRAVLRRKKVVNTHANYVLSHKPTYGNAMGK